MAKTKTKLRDAQRVVEDLFKILRPHCARVAVAGSVRRCERDVGDIEMVVIPKFEEDLVGDPTISELDAVVSQFEPLSKDGPKYKQFHFRACRLTCLSRLLRPGALSWPFEPVHGSSASAW